MFKRVDDQWFDRTDEGNEVVVSNVPGRDEEEPSGGAVQQMCVEEVAILRDHNTLIAVRGAADLGISGAVTVRKFARVDDIVTERRKRFRKSDRKLSVDEQLHAAEIGTEERVRVTSAAYSNEASTSSASRSA